LVFPWAVVGQQAAFFVVDKPKGVVLIGELPGIVGGPITTHNKSYGNFHHLIYSIAYPDLAG
jgi:hypothetical protein